MSWVVNQDNTYKEVKNLGWLLAHWQEVEGFRVLNGNIQVVDGWRIPEPPSYSPNHYKDSVMVAHLKDGRKYVTRWASYSVMLDWLHRPKFIGLPISWFGWSMRIGTSLEDTLKK